RARSLFATIANDLSPALPAPLPSRFQTSGGQAGGGGTGATPGGTTPATGASGQNTGTTPGGVAAAASATTSVVDSGSFLFTVQGTSSQLTVFISRVPQAPSYGADNPAVVSDIRRITYWLAGSTSDPLALAREEVRRVTSDDEAPVPPDIPDEASFVKAEEVKSLQFSYFDGNEWLDSWDGAAPGSDGVTPQGPPPLIAITIGLAPGNGPSDQ